MTKTDYRRALDRACREYERLTGERVALEERIDQLVEAIGTLTKLCGLAPSVPWGITDACRTVLRNAARPMTPVEVRNRLASIGFDLARYSNDLSAIHTVLKRLNQSGELRFVLMGRGGFGGPGGGRGFGAGGVGPGGLNAVASARD